MVNISEQKIRKYNQIIKENPRGVAKLERLNEFPLALVEFELSPITIEDYSKLVAWSGEKNAQYLTSSVHAFPRQWIFLDSSTKARNSFQEDNKKNRLILSIADCFTPKLIEINSMDFFHKLEKTPYYEDISSQEYEQGIGKTTIPYDSILPQRRGNLELSVVDKIVKRASHEFYSNVSRSH